ncbi:unnamed protein product [Rotaria sp. Silwood2]|nr:unnamed protein product [Rotaria sp. Silwood2]
MNNSSFSSNNNNNNKYDKKENINNIHNVIPDDTENGADELTLRNSNALEVLSEDQSNLSIRRSRIGRPVDSISTSILPTNTVTNSQLNLRIIDFNDLYIGDTIGVGGFGHVFHGKFGNVDVAIKTAKSFASFCSIPITNYDDTSDAVQKTLIDGLLREARLFSNLKHRNIIQLFGVSPSLSTKNLYLVMEYAHGGALNHLLRKRQSGLYPNVFIQYAKQIADGMRYLHEEACEHIIHRDLKCSNILILEHINDVHNDSDLLYKTLKITDFGLARKQLQSSSVSTAGTFAWMSPECIRNTEFSTKSDVWSFGVLLWECLTGEIPYKGFDPMQVAFGIATNKYSLPIPSTCPEEFSQLMTNCWKICPPDRPTFSMLLEQINKIIEVNYTTNEINHMEPNEESYQSLQKDWRQEIQDMFNELKEKEQEIRDREQAIHQRILEQNHQRLQLEKWEQQLYEREMHIVELELQLLIAKNNQQRTHHHTPKLSNRSGGFFRSILNGNNNLSSSTNTLISSPTNFRHLISVCHNQPTIDPTLSPNIPILSPSFSSSTSCPMPPNSINNPSNSQFNRSYSSNSTPTTPNMSRLRTLTFLLFDNLKLIKKFFFSNVGSSSSSLCSTPNDRSLARAVFDINSMLLSVGLGHRIPTPIDSSSIRTFQQQQQPTVVCSTNETVKTKYHKQINSIPLTNDTTKQTTELINIDYRSEPFCSPIRPNSLILLSSSSSSQNSSQKNPIISTTIENQQITDDDNEKYYSAQSSKISTPMIHSVDLSSYRENFEDKLILSSIIDIDNDEQKRHHSTKLLPTQIENNKNFSISPHVLAKDFLN